MFEFAMASRRHWSRRRIELVSIWLPVTLLVGMTGVGRAADELVDYQKQIKPILTSRCVSCHGVLKQEGNLRLDTAAQAIKGGDSGAAITPGDTDASLLLKRISAKEESERMPPEGEPLKPEQIDAIRNWIAQKAPAPANEQPERDPRDHWSFRPIVRPQVPLIEHPTAEQQRWQRNPIDAFISQAHREHGLVPQPEASKRVWLRRVSLDLVGLPPTAEELDDFVADQSSEAHDRVVTRLLESPQYGERWGRHWMDIWRYSDWWGLGEEVRNSQKHMWHWRDWIVESLNEDKGYDQMLREMLAADEMYPNDLDKLRANGFLARPFFLFNRTLWLDETIEHTSKAMLGLTMNCCKCHDHKYDPLSQVEYHSMRAIFEPYQIRTEMIPGQADFEQDGIARVFDANLEAPTYLHVRGAEDNQDKSRVIPPTVPAMLQSEQLKMKVESVDLPIEATNPGLRDYIIATHRESARKKIAEAQTAIETARQKLLESEKAAKELVAAEAEKAELAKRIAARNAAVRAADMARPADALKVANAQAVVVTYDDFSAPKPEVWQQLAGSWCYTNGRLAQTQTAGVRAMLQLKQLPPTDFEARLKFIVGNGGAAKSVGIAFDMTESDSEIAAYVSAGEGKSQIAIKPAGGAYQYPSVAAKACKVELNQPHEIIVRARGRLINLLYDNQPPITLRLPTTWDRQPGYLALVGSDAAVEFVSFELTTLAGDAKLIHIENLDLLGDPKPSAPQQTSPPPLPVDQAKLVVTIAEKAAIAAKYYQQSLEARIVADRAVILGPDITSIPGESGPEFQARKDAARDSLVAAAIKTENVFALAKADEEFDRKQLASLQDPNRYMMFTQKNLDDAKFAFEAARATVDKLLASHTPIAGAKKTPENFNTPNLDKPFPKTSTGRRTAFAKWVTDQRNPLTARVAVNHIWARHMGKPLVPTVFDFGRKGQPPTNPELLDWLASELIERNWSMKHIHRLIVTSQAYRLSSSSDHVDKATLASDSENRFYWRMNPVRMDSQTIRDSVLWLSGEMDLKMGGPTVSVKDETSRRRSLYYTHSFVDHQQFLSTFDDANVLDCYRRVESIVPQQALALENSTFVTDMSGKIMQRLSAAHPNASDADFIREAYITVLSTEPTSEERATMSDILHRITEMARSRKRPNPEILARTTIIQNLLNLNDFITVR